jgi:hypothetical protein
MRASGPAAGPAFSVYQIRTRSFDPAVSGFRLFGGFNPAYPLIAGEGRDIFPCGQNFRTGKKRFSQILRQLVNDTGGDFFLDHGFMR